MTFPVKGQIRDASSDRAIENVPVSNGEHVVQTDADGRYALEVSPGGHRFVFVTVPDGFRPGEGFYRSTIGWTREQRDVDFDLTRLPDGDRRAFSMAHISDTHVVLDEGRIQGEVLSQDLRQLEREANPDLIVASGDLTDWGTLEELEQFHAAIKSVSTPVLPMFGGHDGNQERFGDLTVDELVALKHRREYAKIEEILKQREGEPFTRHYERVLGPPYYSFDRGRWHFVLYPNEDNFYPARDRKRKEDWLWADLSQQPRDRRSVVFLHKPPSIPFLNSLRRYGVKLVMHGHWHSSKVFTRDGMVVAAVPPLCFGGLDTRPRGYRLVEYREEDFEFRLKPLARTASPQPREDNESISLDETGNGLRLLWTHRLPVGLHRAAPVRSGDRILVSLADEGFPAQSGVACVDARSGALAWRVSTDTAVKNSVAVTPPAATADIGTDLCAAVCVAGRIYAIEMESGQVRWKADLPGFPERWIYASPVIDGETVYAGGKAGMGAYNLKTGARQWYAEIEGGDGWPCYASPRVFGDLLILLVQRRGLMALDRRNGKVVWERTLGVENPYARPVVDGGLLVTGSGAPALHWYGGEPAQLAVLSVNSGEVVWNRAVLPSRYPTGLAVRDGRLYTTTPHGEAFCLDLQSGEVLWRFQTSNDLMDMVPARREVRSILAAPVIYGDRLLICGGDGCVYILNALTGACVSRTTLGSPITAAPCLTEGGFCVGACDGMLYCFAECEE
ncbi:MAG: PQQ-binding-like beta-propeller repeat protein [Gemmatimonadetes bacterium]|nr:PQQ-binding-like beta-propeller repeat protein [Gemmatimonadota bacterium]